jgi:DNA polymerase-3 subunit delta
METRAMDMLLERVGFHPVAVVMELEKLALFVEDRPLISCADLETMVGRTREDALFELTEAFGNRQVAATLVILGRLLENGIHALAILATMRNYIRKMLLFRSLQLQSSPSWQRGMQAAQFQEAYLPALKEKGVWVEMLKVHPYALYMSFKKAENFSVSILKEWLTLLLKTEFQMKGSSLPPTLLLEELFLTLFAGNKR